MLCCRSSRFIIHWKSCLMASENARAWIAMYRLSFRIWKLLHRIWRSRIWYAPENQPCNIIFKISTLIVAIDVAICTSCLLAEKNDVSICTSCLLVKKLIVFVVVESHNVKCRPRETCPDKGLSGCYGSGGAEICRTRNTSNDYLPREHTNFKCLTVSCRTPACHFGEKMAETGRIPAAISSQMHILWRPAGAPKRGRRSKNHEFFHNTISGIEPEALPHMDWAQTTWPFHCIYFYHVLQHIIRYHCITIHKIE